MKKRLVVCLDGTWNTQDDCTNVLHLYNLTKAKDDQGVEQRKYYDEGVGTGVLDSVSGGAFGEGLERNVREAYDWLVENFEDGEPAKPGEPAEPDEIFIFGFSRGAFTARSLVGFIACCGLLRRGAPLTVTQLWDGYGEVQLAKEEREGFWDRSVAKRPFRNLERIDAPANLTEQLLKTWSRRVRIRFLGVFDTVGALGLDALAIPGLRDPSARAHNMAPSSLIQSCGHALAIDENRGSFVHTPMLAWIGSGKFAGNEPVADAASAAGWQQRQQREEQRIEQRWFVGAHSNVGGGYENNVLAARPLAWMCGLAAKQGLALHALPAIAVPPAAAMQRDSFAEFGSGMPAKLLRVKRAFRTIGACTEWRAARLEPVPDGKPQAGHSLRAIHEVVDESVLEFATANPAYAPPNLVAWANRGSVSDPRVKALAQRVPPHVWPTSTAGGVWFTVAWAIVVGAGYDAACRLFCLPQLATPSAGGSIAALAVLVDLAESRCNHRRASSCTLDVAASAVRDALFWLRAVAVILFGLGAIAAIGAAVTAGATAQFEPTRFDEGGFWWPWWHLPSGAGLGMLLAVTIEVCRGAHRPNGARAWWRGVAGVAGGIAAAMAGVAALAGAGIVGERALAHLGWHLELSTAAASPASGHLLLLAVLFTAVGNSFLWVGEPMGRRARLGSLGRLMWVSPAAVERRLAAFVQRMQSWWSPPSAAKQAAAEQVRDAVRAALWRDAFGLVPVYSLATAAGMWCACDDLGCRWLGGPWYHSWWGIALAGAVADEIENLLHARWLRVENGGFVRPGWIEWAVATLATAVKFAALVVGAAASIAAFVALLWRTVVVDAASGWRGVVAILLGILAIAMVAMIGVSWCRAYRARRRNTQNRAAAVTDAS